MYGGTRTKISDDGSEEQSRIGCKRRTMQACQRVDASEWTRRGEGGVDVVWEDVSRESVVVDWERGICQSVGVQRE